MRKNITQSSKVHTNRFPLPCFRFRSHQPRFDDESAAASIVCTSMLKKKSFSWQRNVEKIRLNGTHEGEKTKECVKMFIQGFACSRQKTSFFMFFDRDKNAWCFFSVHMYLQHAKNRHRRALFVWVWQRERTLCTNAACLSILVKHEKLDLFSLRFHTQSHEHKHDDDDVYTRDFSYLEKC